LIKASRISFLWWCPKILLPILWWPATIRIDAMHRLGVAMLAVIVMRGPWASFVLEFFLYCSSL
jgi:hypothetical protein